MPVNRKIISAPASRNNTVFRSFFQSIGRSSIIVDLRPDSEIGSAVATFSPKICDILITRARNEGKEDGRLHRISLMLPVTVRNDGETFVLQPERGPIWIGNEKLQTSSLARFQRSEHCDNPLSRLRTLLRENFVLYPSL